ncbi:uncharacterized protein [Argopecten irradians]|uniref:uncharacterized protein n=1 Tax=Argopecten irradians TaxID=31199 RepID=UPI00371728E1
MGPLATNIWKSLFTVHELTEIMRQKDDKDFAELLNRMRTMESDKLSDGDIATLKSRMLTPEDKHYPQNAPHLYTTNKQVDNFNTDMFDRSAGVKVQIPSLDTVNGDFSKSVKERLVQALPCDVSKTAGLMTIVPVAVGMVYEVTANLNIEDGLVNGACCVVKHIEYKQANTDRPSVVWVQFEDDKTGVETRRTYKHLQTADVLYSWTPIFDTQQTFLYNKKTYIRIQFPLRPAAAKTIHKSQGCTLQNVVFDMTSSRKQSHMHYVAFSRVRKLSDLHILNLNVEKMSVDPAVRDEMTRMYKDAKLQLCYTPPYHLPPQKLKVAFLNVRSLVLHHRDMQNDPNIINHDVILCAKTKLKPSISDASLSLEAFNIERNDQKHTTTPHHGLVMYSGNNIQLHDVQSFSSFDFECLSAKVAKNTQSLQVIAVYKSPKCPYSKLKSEIQAHVFSVLDFDKPYVVLGDFNINISENNDFENWMNETFHCRQIIHSATTDNNSTLDLIFTNVSNLESSYIECCWTDHKLVYCAL